METTNRRVVVTGLGVVSPVGNTVDACWKNLIAGVHGDVPQLDGILQHGMELRVIFELRRAAEAARLAAL